MNPQKTFFSLPAAPSDCNGPAKAWTQAVRIPTYEPATPDKNPLFLEKRVHQVSTGKVYPLPVIDAVSTVAQNRPWQALPVQNELIRRMILPDIGGRIHIGLDTTNGYDFLYRQNVRKPALVGLAGPRASGSVEFNWPQHHRPATFMPVNRHIEKHPDGACTIRLNDLSWYGNIHVPTGYMAIGLRRYYSMLLQKMRNITMLRLNSWIALMVVAAVLVLLSPRGHAQGAQRLVRHSGTPVKFVRTGHGDYFADFGLDWFGQLRLRLTSPATGPSVTVLLGEKLSGPDRIDPHPGGYIAFHQVSIRLRKGTHVYNVPLTKRDARRMPAYIGAVMPFRYAQVIGCPSALTRQDMVQIRVHYPFDRKIAQFKSSNRNLNAVWNLCHHTIEAVSFCGLFVDGNRERRPYEADDLIAELDWFNNTTDTTLPEISDQYLIYHPTWPTEWIMQSVLMAWYDYLYTGDKTLIRHNYAALKAKTLVALERPDGLISTVTPPVPRSVLRSIYRRRPIRDVVDWPPDERDGFVMRPINTVVNAFHYRSLVLMSRIAGALGHIRDQRFFESRARLLRRTMNKLLISKQTGLYVDGIGTTHSSLQANLFPLAFGLVPKADQDRIENFLIHQGMRCSVYGAQFLLQALYRAGHGEAALKLMISRSRHSWMHMLAEGSTITTEAWTFHSKPNEDWNHVWGSAPANIIPRYLMGIRPLAPGFTKALIAPQPGNLTAANITVPTVHGTIAESWSRKGRNISMTVTVPPGITARIQLPASLMHGMELQFNGKRITPQRDGKYIFIHGVPAGRQRITISRPSE